MTRFTLLCVLCVAACAGRAVGLPGEEVVPEVEAEVMGSEPKREWIQVGDCQGGAFYNDNAFAVCVLWDGDADLDLHLRQSDGSCGWDDAVHYQRAHPDWCEERGSLGPECLTSSDCIEPYQSCVPVGGGSYACANVADDPRLTGDTNGSCEGLDAECIVLPSPCAGDYELGVEFFASEYAVPATEYPEIIFFAYGKEVQLTSGVFGHELGSQQMWTVGTVHIDEDTVPSFTPAETCLGGNPVADSCEADSCEATE